MPGATLEDIVLWFVVYSFIGWICELLYRLFVDKVFADPGFLNLPLVPIYGFGALSAIYLLAPWIDNPLMVFLLGAFVATLLEYVTSFVLEKLFNKKLWDYTNMPLNFQGRVCIQMSVLFGGLVLALMYNIHPFLSSMTSAFSPGVKGVVSWLFLVLMAIDFVVSSAAAIGLRFNADYKSTRTVLQTLADLDARWDDLRFGRRKGQAVFLNKLINRINKYILSRLGKSFPALKQV